MRTNGKMIDCSRGIGPEAYGSGWHQWIWNLCPHVAYKLSVRNVDAGHKDGKELYKRIEIYCKPSDRWIRRRNVSYLNSNLTHYICFLAKLSNFLEAIYECQCVVVYIIHLVTIKSSSRDFVWQEIIFSLPVSIRNWLGCGFDWLSIRTLGWGITIGTAIPDGK